MSRSDQPPGFLARHIRSLTKCLCHPVMAWITFLLLAFYNLILVLGMDHYLDKSPARIKGQIVFHRDYLDNQDAIIEDLEKALAASSDPHIGVLGLFDSSI